ncbi:penicillin-binding transpeptidase domain-containing protein [Thalassotalea atypica]|uniref:penicillin-binding transpeptidase domain-containing protein n=1 Tax=Thalassotalea atypica TaxID=2054316 RepID=UPI00257242F9|nr:penicillin-binding transpeptidase domain-containing protein [Thalassotalea atypica]
MTTATEKKRRLNQKPTTVAWRFYVVLGIVALIYCGLMARTAYIQVIEPDMLKKQGDMRSLRTAAKTVQRGSIVDRNGTELAVSVPVETVWADPKVVMDKNGLAMVEHWRALADVLGQDVNKLTSRIVRQPNKRFVYVERQVSPVMANYIKELKIPGIHLRKESKRFYPAGEISAHLVGFTNVDDKGIEGIERVYDALLTGKGGAKKFRKDAKGRKIEILSVEEAQPPKDLTLSIDQRIQAIAYRELKGAVRAFKATSGSVIVVDVETGELLSLVNSPSYNPNNRGNTPANRIRNRAITDMFEPGSTMKPLSLLTAMEFGIADAGTVVNTSPGWMRLGGRRIGDPINRGELTMEEILIHSSNMGTAKLALAMPKEYLIDKFFEVGFSEDTGSGLVGESSGMMSDRNRWSQHELASLSYGYNLAITPMQLARFYATVANGGIKRPFSITKVDRPVEGERLFSENLTADLRLMLEGVVEKGAKKAQVDGYRVGGKTGTSIKAVAGGYGNDYVGLFAGMAPIDDPKVVVVVVINEPGGDLYHGGDVAAPVFSRVMKGALQVLNIAPQLNKVAVKSTSRKELDNA